MIRFGEHVELAPVSFIKPVKVFGVIINIVINHDQLGLCVPDPYATSQMG